MCFISLRWCKTLWVEMLKLWRSSTSLLQNTILTRRSHLLCNRERKNSVLLCFSTKKTQQNNTWTLWTLQLCNKSEGHNQQRSEKCGKQRDCPAERGACHFHNQLFKYVHFYLELNHKIIWMYFFPGDHETEIWAERGRGRCLNRSAS